MSTVSNLDYEKKGGIKITKKNISLNSKKTRPVGKNHHHGIALRDRSRKPPEPWPMPL
jgi:hypothetical protein